jgi:hypothetical protein
MPPVAMSGVVAGWALRFTNLRPTGDDSVPVSPSARARSEPCAES